jgi:hypothetical protein
MNPKYHIEIEIDGTVDVIKARAGAALRLLANRIEAVDEMADLVNLQFASGGAGGPSMSCTVTKVSNPGNVV